MLVKKNTSMFRPQLALILFAGSILTILTFVVAQAASADGHNFSDWSAPVNLGPVVNTTFNDQQPGISKDGRSLYFTSTRPGGFGTFDLYVSQRASTDDPWGPPINLGATINTPFDEGNPAFSRDGHFMFFQSNRPGGFGLVDIWVSYRQKKHDDFGWQTPVNLGPGVNSTANENGPTYFANEQDGEDEEEGASQLFFGSDRPGGLGSADIYMSERTAAGDFGPAVLVMELNSPMNEGPPSIRPDGLEIFLQSNRAGSFGNNDLWVATRATTLDAWSTPVNLGSTINTAANEQNPELSSDGLTLFFASDRPGGLGAPDLYMITRMKVSAVSLRTTTRPESKSITRPYASAVMDGLQRHENRLLLPRLYSLR